MALQSQVATAGHWFQFASPAGSAEGDHGEGFAEVARAVLAARAPITRR